MTAASAPRAIAHACRRPVRWLLAALLAWAIAPLSSPSVLAAAPPASRSIVYTAYTRGGNLYMVDGSGARATLTTKASTTEPSRISYPWYAWSPDGAFLLLVRQHPSDTQGGTSGPWDLLLLDRQGDLVRTLATNLPRAPFYPNWSVDSDQIAYETSVTQTNRANCCLVTLHHQVRVVDPSGHPMGGWHYTTQIYADGGPRDGWLGHAGAEWLYLREQGWVGDAQVLLPRLSLVWSVRRHLAIFDVGDGGLAFVSLDTTTGKTRSISKWNEWASLALAPSGDMLAVGTTEDPRIVLIDPRSGAMLHIVSSGEQPAWSPDGRWLYYEQRAPVRRLTFSGAGLGWQLMDGSTYTATPMAQEDAYRSAIWRVAPTAGSAPERLTLQDAYALGPAKPVGDGRTVIYSQVDNSWEFLRHPTADAATRVRRYGPRVRVQRLDPDGRVTTLASDAGLPAAQP